MARPFRQQVDEGILDRAAALFARRGFAKTSVQDVAVAVGLSKAGLLHHFPSKDVLYAAVLAHAEDIGSRVLREVAALPLGADRDRRAIEALVDVALAHPGIVALLLAPAAQLGGNADDPPPAQSEAALLAFGVTAEDADEERLVRVIGALSAIAVLTLTASAEGRATAWRRYIVSTCLDALGHRRPDAVLPHPHPVEA
ncbi:TetR/AcrR family transcriptional regulator [Blastococcus sp. URHD0036]|uniref:TetR/AcrR family transcriptional regulator n=1 Tax=Blastococcus sp. URHD0036 TaxID=1380356 RepID=UPI0004975929|nr:TetR/AcrR family transcriptional regulator [Blastococcus sp. URHD0036]